MLDKDGTIAAISTAVGGAVSIIRISGPDARKTSTNVWRGNLKLAEENARMMLLGKCSSADNKFSETAMAVFFPAPNSYTGEDMVEIQCHGGALVTKMILGLVLDSGARAAMPGEFTFRAFMNGKMDLTQAEGIADLISAQSTMAVNLAERQIHGTMGKNVRKIREKVLHVLAESESRLDFGEENLDWKSPELLIAGIKESTAAIEKLLMNKTEGEVLRNGVRIVIAGRPNVGKSSLLNLLLGFDRAIVTPLPGTTRDTVEETTSIRNIPVRLIDTAGIRDADNLIENKGIERSFASLAQAQIIIWLLDASEDPEDEISTMRLHCKKRDNTIAVWNKTDLAGEKILPGTEFPAVNISVEKKTGIEELLDLLEKTVWRYPHMDEPEIAVSARHAALLENAASSLRPAPEKILHGEWELAAIHLRSAISALGRITGEDTEPDILDEIFSRFCIGK